MTWIIIGFSIFYALLFTSFIIGWLRIKTTHVKDQNQNYNTFISIIIPARNEEANIEQTLHDLMTQNYPSRLYEVILVDDHSEDKTLELCGLFNAAFMLKGTKLRLIKMSESKSFVTNSYKKAAIEEGIKHSSGEWIITTDADCRRGKNWLAAIVQTIENDKPVLVSAPVKIRGKSNFLSIIQELEFTGLVGIGAAGIKNNHPNMCNGANLAYKKDVFYETGGYKGIDHIASGDDELLMHKIAKKYPDRVQFVKSKEAIVTTAPQIHLKGFIQQRKRWVSKALQYKNVKLIVVLFLVYLFHLFLLINGIRYLIAPMENFAGFFIPLYVKIQFEFLFLFLVSGFFNNRLKLIWYLAALPIYIIYVILIGILGNFAGKYEWKGRIVK